MEDYRNEMGDVVNEGDQRIYELVLGAVYTSDSANQSGGWELGYLNAAGVSIFS